jgi:hypothetical protein
MMACTRSSLSALGWPGLRSVSTRQPGCDSEKRQMNVPAGSPRSAATVPWRSMSKPAMTQGSSRFHSWRAGVGAWGQMGQGEG